ncbi:LuxR family transcriptional regulator [Amorphus sp. MBR-141]
MRMIFEGFIDHLSGGVNYSDLRMALSIAADELEIRSFAYLLMPFETVKEPQLVSNYPSCWTSRYINNNYEQIDPVIEVARCGTCPFQWDAEFGRSDTSRRQQQLFEEAAEFGIRCGLTIPIHDRRGNVAAMTFAADERNPPFLRIAERYELALQLVATCFHIHARRVLSGDRMVDGVVLTPREYECLQWATRGKSAWEIGCILGITRRTAAFHLDNVRTKLGVRTIAQAVARLAASRSFSTEGEFVSVYTHRLFWRG